MGSSSFIGVVCGLQSEAVSVKLACATAECPEKNLRIGVSGANAARAEEIARAFCDDGALCIISAGVSGGLDPSLRPGDLVVSDCAVIEQGGQFLKAEMSLVDEIAGAVKQCVPGESRPQGETYLGAVYGSDVIIDSPEHKARIFQATGCLAVDMESHGAARAAIDAKIPFIAVRAIADPAQRVLPPAALNAVRADGSTDIWAVLKALARRPQQLPALSALGVDARVADQRMRAAFGVIARRLLFRLNLG